MRLGRVRFEAKYLAIQHFHAEKGWSIRWMCRQLGISKAAYYKWLHRSAVNVLKRDFNASSPNEKWVTDVTEFKWYEGPVCHKLYLSAILDLYDRSVVSHVISRRNDNKLVFQTFDKAIANNPDAKPIFHSSEMYYLQTFKDEKSLRSAIEKYIHFYNYERFQERFETRTPMEVRTEALNSDAPALYPIPENKRIQKYKEKFAA